jgi:hypothetical protein
MLSGSVSFPLSTSNFITLGSALAPMSPSEGKRGGKDAKPRAKTPLVDTIAVGHPSLLTKDDIDGVAVPVQLLAPQHDRGFTEDLKMHAFRTLVRRSRSTTSTSQASSTGWKGEGARGLTRMVVDIHADLREGTAIIGPISMMAFMSRCACMRVRKHGGTGACLGDAQGGGFFSRRSPCIAFIVTQRTVSEPIRC